MRLMTYWPRTSTIAVCLTAVLVAGCATHRSPALTDRLLRQGKPTIELGAPTTTAPTESLEAYVARVRRLAAAARTSSASTLTPTLESLTPGLAAALLSLRAAPTGANYRSVGEAYLQLGVLDMALEYLRQAVQLNPTDARSYDQLARISRNSGYPQLGLGDAYRATHLVPDSPEAYNTLGTLLQAVGQNNSARAAYERALALDGTAAYALNNLCYLSFLDGKAAAAVAACQSALRLRPEGRPTRNNLGLAYASLGDLQSARREFSWQARPARAAYNVGIVELASGNFAAAAEAFQAAYRADPTLHQAARRAEQARHWAARNQPEDPDYDRN